MPKFYLYRPDLVRCFLPQTKSRSKDPGQKMREMICEMPQDFPDGPA